MKNLSNSYLSAARSNRDGDDDEDNGEDQERRKIIQDEADNSISKWQCVKLF